MLFGAYLLKKWDVIFRTEILIFFSNGCLFLTAQSKTLKILKEALLKPLDVNFLQQREPDISLFKGSHRLKVKFSE